MTRKYKLERLQKNILLGMTGIALSSTIMFAGAQSPEAMNRSNNRNNATNTKMGIKLLNKAEKEKKNVCKAEHLTARKNIKLGADKAYMDAVKLLKEKRLSDLSATKTATTTATTTKLMNKERQAMRHAIEDKYKIEIRKLKDIRYSNRAKADDIYDQNMSTCINTNTN